jgi:putative flippase GtrA
MTDGESTPRLAWPRAVGWGAFLACSWTWCIGMFLPILFVRDYGIWGFVIFATPNVIGAAAMGWVLRRPGAAQSLLETHAGATLWFSRITIAFQIFFLAWIVSGLVRLDDLETTWKWLAVAAVPVVGVLVLPSVASEHGSNMRRLVGACVIWCVSIVAAVIAITTTDLQTWTIPVPTTSMGAAFVAPVCAFGFLLCPYLDRTFLRARRSAPGPTGTAAFLIGFGVLFFTMILFTLFYASGSLGADSLGMYITTSAAGVAVYIHLLMQLAYTINVHRQELPAKNTGMVAAIAAIVLLVLFAFATNLDTTFRNQTLGEVIYRSFISCYGYIFPGYVYLVMIPTRDGHSGPHHESGRKKLRVFFFAVGIAAPMMWVGFIERIELWLVPGLAIVLLARLALPRQKNHTPETTDSATSP